MTNKLTVYKKESILIINYSNYRGLIIKRLLKITEKVLQLKKIVKRIIRKS